MQQPLPARSPGSLHSGRHTPWRARPASQGGSSSATARPAGSPPTMIKHPPTAASPPPPLNQVGSSAITRQAPPASFPGPNSYTSTVNAIAGFCWWSCPPQTATAEEEAEEISTASQPAPRAQPICGSCSHRPAPATHISAATVRSARPAADPVTPPATSSHRAATASAAAPNQARPTDSCGVAPGASQLERRTSKHWTAALGTPAASAPPQTAIPGRSPGSAQATARQPRRGPAGRGGALLHPPPPSPLPPPAALCCPKWKTSVCGGVPPVTVEIPPASNSTPATTPQAPERVNSAQFNPPRRETTETWERQGGERARERVRVTRQ